MWAKAVERVSQTWEGLIDDEELEKVTEQLCTTKTEVTQMKNVIKKLPLVEKIAKVAKMKKV